MLNIEVNRSAEGVERDCGFAYSLRLASALPVNSPLQLAGPRAGQEARRAMPRTVDPFRWA